MTHGPAVPLRRPRRDLRLVALVALAGALAPALLAGGARSAGDALGLIAFKRADGIYVMRADGSHIGALRRGSVASRATGLAWSPDGRRLAFASGLGIWVMDADGSDLVRLVRPSAEAGQMLVSATWSPDGKKLAYSAKSGGNRDVWSVNADGSGSRRLRETDPAWEWEVDWSPAGDRLAYVDGLGWFLQLWVMNADGSNPTNAIWPRFSVTSQQPHWAPDGRRIAFVRSPPSANTREEELYLVDPSSGRQVRLTRNSVSDRHPSWSTDGSRIAFVRGSVDPQPCIGCPLERRGPAEIYVMNADGTGLTRLTHDRLNEADPAWQPVRAR